VELKQTFLSIMLVRITGPSRTIVELKLLKTVSTIFDIQGPSRTIVELKRAFYIWFLRNGLGPSRTIVELKPMDSSLSLLGLESQSNHSGIETDTDCQLFNGRMSPSRTIVELKQWTCNIWIFNTIRPSRTIVELKLLYRHGNLYWNNKSQSNHSGIETCI